MVHMKSTLRILCVLVVMVGLVAAANVSAQMKLGVDVLQESGFAALQGKRVGIVTNHTGLNSAGVHLVKLLNAAEGVKVEKLFSPEHGLYGIKDEKVDDMVDAETGLKVYSLYGKTRRPTPEMLAGLDVVVFDIQDIGTRFYTYISTMGLLMEECAKAGVEVVVLDRPNPIGGVRVEGPIADKAHQGFTAYGPIPVVHGMTVGELAKMFNTEYGINAKLTVVPMTGWKREMLWDQTGVKWVNPSPNMRSPLQALLYPAIGLLEASNVSVGRGTETPFELFGAPYVKGEELAGALNSPLNGAGLAGLRFEAVKFTPVNTVHKMNKVPCEGVRVILTDEKAYDAVRAGVIFAWTLEKLYPDDYQQELLVKMLQNDAAVAGVYKMENPAGASELWETELAEWKGVRGRYLMYE